MQTSSRKPAVKGTNECFTSHSNSADSNTRATVRRETWSYTSRTKWSSGLAPNNSNTSTSKWRATVKKTILVSSRTCPWPQWCRRNSNYYCSSSIPQRTSRHKTTSIKPKLFEISLNVFDVSIAMPTSFSKNLATKNQKTPENDCWSEVSNSV